MVTSLRRETQPGSARRLTAIRLLTKHDLDQFLARTLSWLRWTTIAALFVITWVQPAPVAERRAEWVLVAGFALYNLVLDLVRRRRPGGNTFVWAAVLDLPAVTMVYAMSTQPGGPLFALIVLAAAQTTAFMTLAGGLLYTGVLAVITVLIEPALPLWLGTIEDYRALSGRLVALALVGVGMGALTRRLEREQSAAQAMFNETTRLAALDQVRTDFVATISHDLRTPLTAARAALVLVDASAGETLRTDERDLLVNARRNVERLSLLIDDLLTSSQRESGVLDLEPVAIDLRTVVTDAMAAVHPLLHSRQQTIDIDLPRPLLCAGDAMKLEHAFLNLLANAHTHTPPGSHISVAGRDGDGGILISVADDGPGVPPNELETIFQRFYRRTTDGTGSGQGLTIARSIVERHGGKLWAENRRDAGVIFCVTLPAAETAAAEIAG